MHEPKYDFFNVVRIRNTPTAMEFDVAGCEGIVLGRSLDEDSWENFYSVHIDGTSYSFEESELEGTGRSIRREDFYDGSRMGVSPEGEVRWVAEPGQEPPPVVGS